MRLLDTETGEFVERKPDEITFAILSHTWDEKGEQSFQELRDIQRRHAPAWRQPQLRSHLRTGEHGPRIYAQLSPPNRPFPSIPFPSRSQAQASDSSPLASTVWTDPELSPKIRDACAVARANGYQYLWIDSCCIDKTSSSELSEAINSMYQWYADAEVCYAFLADVPSNDDHGRGDSFFRRSRWFTRGWTLQELIAPAYVVFLAMDWKYMGSKNSLAYLVTQITGISYNALLRVEPLQEFSVAQRLSWAARRQTTRVEDRAYSLLGIFDINMPTLYGEGERAFRRLQEEIMRRIPDQSLFAWSLTSRLRTTQREAETFMAEPESGYSTSSGSLAHSSLLAPSLDAFIDGSTIETISHDEVIRRLNYLHFPAPEYNFTPHGIRTEIPTIPLSIHTTGTPAEMIEYFPANIPPSYWYLVILGCEHKYVRDRHLLGRVCYMSFSGSSTIEFVHCGRAALPTGPGLVVHRDMIQPRRHWVDLLPLTIATIRALLSSQQINLKSVYIPHPDRPNQLSDVVRRLPHESISLVLLKNTSNALQAEGFTTGLEGPNHFGPHYPTTHRLSLSSQLHEDIITVEYHHTLHRNGRALTIQARVASTQHQVYPSDIFWTDSLPWRRTLGNKQVAIGDLLTLNTAQLNEALVTLNLDVHLATKDHYYLHVEVLNNTQIPRAPVPPTIQLPPIE